MTTGGGYYKTAKGGWGTYEAPPDSNAGPSDDELEPIQLLFVRYLGTPCPQFHEAHDLLMTIGLPRAAIRAMQRWHDALVRCGKSGGYYSDTKWAREMATRLEPLLGERRREVGPW